MNGTINILIVEDVASDAELIERELRKANIPFRSRRVDTKAAFVTALHEFEPAIVLSDYNLPQFSGPEALRLLKLTGMPAPFILITGSLTEEVAVECMKKGAHDYILKTSLTRLPSAVLNALENAKTIEQKVQAEAALYKSEEQYRLIAENTSDLICMVDIHGNYTYVSPSYREVLGYTPESLLGESCFSLIHPDDRMMAEQRTVQSVADKRPGRLELRVKHQDGKWKIFEILGNWIYDSLGRPQRCILVSRDITKRKEAEDTLRESEEKTRLILENALDAVVTINADGLITGWNPQAEVTFGWSIEEAIGKSLVQLIVPPKYREAHRTGLENYLLTGQGPVVNKRIEITALRRDGSEFPVELSVSPMQAGDTFIFSAFIRDISDRKVAEEKLRLSEEQLRMSQKLEAVGQLAGGVAHDFNNLLTVISGYSDLVLTRLDERDTNRSKVEEIKRAAERASSLTRQLLAFSRKQVLQPKLFSLNGLVEDMGKMLRRLIGENIELTTVFREELLINADPGQMEQVLMNLVVNARDAMPNGGHITIETTQIEINETYASTHLTVQPGRYAMLAVSDTGNGMDVETQKHMFEPFFTTKEQGKGTGLGLSTVYGIVKQSGGNIWVYSEPAQGTVFKIYLPLAVKDEAASSTLPAAPAPEHGTETILLVEDEPQIRQLAFEILTHCGYNVLSSANGLEALELIEHAQSPIDLILTDVVMPQMSGKELAERALALHPTVKVLFMSGYTNDAIVKHGVLDAGTWFIQKPFALNALARRVREVLDSNESLQKHTGSNVTDSSNGSSAEPAKAAR
jgi:PAS domain S-box-containing protein